MREWGVRTPRSVTLSFDLTRGTMNDSTHVSSMNGLYIFL